MKIYQLILLLISLTSAAMGASRKVCRDALNRAQPYYQKLHHYRPPMSSRKPQPYQFTRLQPKHCKKSFRKKSMPIIRHTLRKHQNKIGLLLPLSGPYRPLSQSFIAGLKQAAREYNLPESLFVVRSTTTKGGVLQPLAQLVFDDDVAMIIGGLLPNEAEVLSTWSDGLERPTLILNQDTKYVENKIYAYQFYPAPSSLADALLRQALARQQHHIAILQPSHGHSDAIIARFQELAPRMQVHITEIIPYTSGQFDSMNHAAEAVFHTHPSGREEEYRLALKERADAAQKAGINFDASKVILPPKPLAQAIFIPDDFRMVRHFTKLFRYHGVQKFPLLGDHTWRSKGLIEPWDDFLQSSYFADFIPRYNDLPIPTSSTSPWFLDPHQVVDIDFKVLGFHLGHLTQQAFRQDILRTMLLQRLVRSRALFSKGQGTYFSKQHTTTWPRWILGLKEHDLSLLPPDQVPYSQQPSQTKNPRSDGGRG